MPGIREAIAVPTRKGGVAPLVPKLLASMDDDLRTAALALLASEHSDSWVAQAFTDDDYPVSQGAVRAYRVANKVSRFAP